ncbi:MAG: hypothetical protein LDL41_22265 [Coleofasciculus sp. S288]|nr:hypothetical protein [Coleofasciculus sp. S288]
MSRLTTTVPAIRSLCGDSPAILMLEKRFGGYLEGIEHRHKWVLVATISNCLAAHANAEEGEINYSLEDAYHDAVAEMPNELLEVLELLNNLLNSDELATLCEAIVQFANHTHWEK